MLLKMKKYWKNERGFTLIEMLFVILIIGLLTTIGVPAVTKHMEVAKISAEKSSMLIVKNAAKRYLLEVGIPDTDMAHGQVKAALLAGQYIDAPWPETLDEVDIQCSITDEGLITVIGSADYGGTITGY